MRSGTLAALALGVVAFSALASAEQAVAAKRAVSRVAYRHCRCSAEWAHREYWQRDHRPIWDDPWPVLKPNFFGSPEPHLVPADIWARKWHPPWPHYSRLHHRHWIRDP